MKICVILSDSINIINIWSSKSDWCDSSASKVIDLIFDPFCITDNNVEDISSCKTSFHLQNIFIQCRNCVMFFFKYPIFSFKSVIFLFAFFSSASKLIISFVLDSDLSRTCPCIHTVQCPSWWALFFFLGFSLRYSLKIKRLLKSK